MTASAEPPPAAPRPPAVTHILLPSQWTPQQARAVFDLLAKLRAAGHLLGDDDDLSDHSPR
jgi:hypothetical protein